MTSYDSHRVNNPCGQSLPLNLQIPIIIVIIIIMIIMIIIIIMIIMIIIIIIIIIIIKIIVVILFSLFSHMPPPLLSRSALSGLKLAAELY